MGDFEQMRIDVVDVQRLQIACDLPVEALPPRRAWLVVEDVANQRGGGVGSVRLASQQVLPTRLFEQEQHAVLIGAAHDRKLLEMNRIAEEGGERQYVPTCVADG